MLRIARMRLKIDTERHVKADRRLGGTRNRDVVVRLKIASASRGRRSAFVDALCRGFKENY